MDDYMNVANEVAMNRDDSRQIAGDWARVLRDVMKAFATGREPEDVQAERHARERAAVRKGGKDVINLDDVSNCPVGTRCDFCWNSEFPEELVVITASTQVGVYCTTICPCVLWRSASANSIPVAAAAQRALEHCTHLGITADQMAAAMEEEKTWPGRR